MKNGFVVFFTAAVLCLVSCSERRRVVERPSFGASNNTTLEIDRIVLSDTATVFYFDAYYRPKYWIRLAKTTSLRVGDSLYRAISADGIVLGKHLWMPQSGDTSFSIVFPALDKSVKSVDFTEDCADGWVIKDIQLRSGAKAPDYSHMIPDSVKRASDTRRAVFGAPAAECALSKVTLHLLGYDRSMCSGKIAVYYNDFVSGEQTEYLADMNDDGTVEFDIPVYSPSRAFARIADHIYLNLYIEAGDNHIWADMARLSRNHSRYCRDEDSRYSVMASGHAGPYVRMMNALPDSLKGGICRLPYSQMSGRSGEEIAEMMTQRYDRLVSAVNKSRLPKFEKDYLKAYMKHNLVYELAMLPYNMESAYIEEQMSKSGMSLSQVIDSMNANGVSIDVVDHKELKPAMRALVDPGDASIMYFENANLDCSAFALCEDGENEYSDDSTFTGRMWRMRQVLSDMDNALPLSAETEQTVRSWDGCYGSMIDVKREHIASIIKANESKTGFTVHETPDAGADKMFDAIISGYKGKVVMVDFWATWCGPCRNAIRQLEPEKQKLIDRGVEFVYITSSSPEAAWRSMIPDIKGNHYKVDAASWTQMCDRFGITGIPAYVIVDKNGRASLREDLRDHGKLVRELTRLSE